MTKIFFLNLKRCLIFSAIVALKAQGSLAAVNHEALKTIVLKDLSHLTNKSFDPLLSKWNKKFGARITPSLVLIAKDKKQKDWNRYVCTLAAAKIGGKGVVKEIEQLLKDKVWTVRIAALRALRAIQHRPSGRLALPLLKDPALVVRNEAVKTVAALKPSGSLRALLDSLEDRRNYVSGKPLWVPGNALNAILKLEDKNSVARGLSSRLAALRTKVKAKKFANEVALKVKTLYSSTQPRP